MAVGVAGGVGHDHLGGQALDQGVGLRAVACLAGGEREADGAAEAAHGQVELGAQAAARAAQGSIVGA